MVILRHLKAFSSSLWAEEMRRAPVDRPAFDGITIGASVRVAAHGWATDGWFIDQVLALQGVRRGTGQIREAKRGDSRSAPRAIGIGLELHAKT